MKRRALAGLTAVGTLAALLGTAGCTDSSESSSDVFTAIQTNIDANAPINPYNQSTNSFQGYNAMKLGWPKNSLTDANAFYPGLAASWTETPDHLKLTIKLQPNAKWSDGKPVTADDVKTSAAMSFSQGGGAFAVAPGAAVSLAASSSSSSPQAAMTRAALITSAAVRRVRMRNSSPVVRGEPRRVRSAWCMVVVPLCCR